MPQAKKRHGGIIAVCLLVAAVLLAGGIYEYWLYCQPKFHDVTVELGTESIDIEAFMTEYADIEKAGIVTDLSTLDIGTVGSVPLTLKNGKKEETVTLTVEDTTPPEVEFVANRREKVGYVPDAEDFVASCQDLSGTSIHFKDEVEIPQDYGDVKFTVVVEDAYGNAVSKACSLTIIWMRDEYDMELGETLTKEDLLFDADRDADKISQEDIDQINASGVGDYEIVSPVDQSTCKIHVADTTAPMLKLKDVSVYKGQAVNVGSFVVGCTDASGDVDVRLSAQPDVNSPGTQTVTVLAEDCYGNKAEATAVLQVLTDQEPPAISGLSTLNVAKNSSPDYMSGVSANDNMDGACAVAYDASGVNISAAGTYYVTYTAQDKSGNTASARRTVVVSHDSSDTNALADSIAAGLGSDPEAIRDYVRNSISYSTSWGGSDPIWYGFTTKSGNCYVHALCLQALLSRKGYATQLIWTTDRTHYWLIISLNGVWRHIDATPASKHRVYSLMTDEQRLSTLSGRTWDTSAWPACG